jgi:DNA polymerase-3 subunit delta
MTPKELFAEVSSGKFKPLYYFFGTEDYRITEAEKFLASQFLPNRQLATNCRRIDGRKTKSADLIAELSIFPMLGERQVFIVSSFQSYKPSEITRILKQLHSDDPNRVVVLNSPSDKAPKKKSSFYKTMFAAAEVVEFKKLTPREMAAAVDRKFSSADLKIEDKARQLLIELIAGNRGALESETDKLLNYKAGSGSETVTEEDIRKLTAGYQVYTIFELADHVVAGEARKALEQIRKLAAEGQSATGVLFHLGVHFISLYLVKNGKPLDSRRRFLTGRFRGQAARYENEQLEKMIIEIAETDAALRRSPPGPQTLLEALVLRLTEAAG